MTSLYLHVGQAGCQLGQRFWSPLTRLVDEDETVRLAFCHPSRAVNAGGFRAVFVDTESKALANSRRRIGAKRVTCVQSGKCGRGSCFPYGFGPQKSQSELDEDFDFLRREAEKLDAFSACVIFHGLGGGTGSGLGARTMTWLRDAFPLVNVLTVSCLGFRDESPVQNYNAALALSVLSDVADGVILVPNDAYGGGSLAELNEAVVTSLHGCFLPTTTLCPGSDRRPSQSHASVSLNLEPSELVRSATPLPSHKFLHVATATQSPDKPGIALATSLSRSLKRFAGAEERERLRFLSTLVVSRNGAFFGPEEQSKLETSIPFVDWNPAPIDVWTGVTSSPNVPRRFTSLTGVANSGAHASYLERVVEKARRLSSVGAFLHWFQKHGCGRDEIESACFDVDEVVRTYRDL